MRCFAFVDPLFVSRLNSHAKHTEDRDPKLVERNEKLLALPERLMRGDARRERGSEEGTTTRKGVNDERRRHKRLWSNRRRSDRCQRELQ